MIVIVCCQTIVLCLCLWVCVSVCAADTIPGVLVSLGGESVFAYGAVPDAFSSASATPGSITGIRHSAVRLQCGSGGSVWLQQLKVNAPGAFKLPATLALPPSALAGVPVVRSPGLFVPHGSRPATFQEIWASVDGDVAYVHFEFYNGAMCTAQCERLSTALAVVASRSDVRVVVLLGGPAFFSNGIHLNTIEGAADPAAESWANINAMNDVVKAVFSMTDKVTVSAVWGNAGAGGVMAALAADFVWTHQNAVLNPHYKSMGLFGSEYWTYFLPLRVGGAMASYITEGLQPLLGEQACEIGLVDRVLCEDKASFVAAVEAAAQALVASGEASRVVAAKREQRTAQWFENVAAHRERELEQMRLCFASGAYHRARASFVSKAPPTCTPLHLSHPKPVVSRSLKAALESGEFAFREKW